MNTELQQLYNNYSTALSNCRWLEYENKEFKTQLQTPNCYSDLIADSGFSESYYNAYLGDPVARLNDRLKENRKKLQSVYKELNSIKKQIKEYHRRHTNNENL